MHCSKYDGVHFKARAREREELLAACKSLIEDCAKMMHFILGSTALDDVREKLELVSVLLYCSVMIRIHNRNIYVQCKNNAYALWWCIGKLNLEIK